MILVTGANGFIGSALVSYLQAQRLSVIGCARSPSAAGSIVVPSLDRTTDWSKALQGVDMIVHTAARVHDIKGIVLEADYIETNALATEQLAKQASKSGVKRFIFLSTIKVNGEETLGKPFTTNDHPAPKDPYARSKWQAECYLKQVCAQSSMQLIILRLPLVYGAGVRANFQTLMKLVAKGVPLPFAKIKNARSLLGLDHLCTFVYLCLKNDRVLGQTLFLSDGHDLSTAELIVKLARSMNRPARLWGVSEYILKKLAALVNKQAWLNRVLGSLEVDPSLAFELLAWRPSLEEIECEFKRTTDYFLAS